MKCPRCGNEWDASKSSCPRCSFPAHSSNSLRLRDYVQATKSQPLLAFSASPQHLSPQTNNTRPGVVRPLRPGTPLRGGRYRLRELVSYQEWLFGAYEATWIAQDAQRSGAQVIMSELVTPDSESMMMQSTLRAATITLTSLGRHSSIPTLRDTFSDRERNFFVFEYIGDESLLARMRRTGHAFSEQEVVECCLQMTDVLELLSQQLPPSVHGLIRPGHIFMDSFGSSYFLTSFSLLLAGGTTQFMKGIDHSHLSPYMAPEFPQGVIDVHSDLYALIATAYHAVTGSVPTVSQGQDTVPSARKLNPAVSQQLDAILVRGLWPVAAQRYQSPSALRQDLLKLHTMSSSLALRGKQSIDHPVATQAFISLGKKPPERPKQKVPGMLPDGVDNKEKEYKLLLSHPEDLLTKDQNKYFYALWIVAILVCLFLAVIIMSSLR